MLERSEIVNMSLVKICSGAQTGADQGGLAAGIQLGLQIGGWMPLGRRTDEGPLSVELFKLWNLREHPLSTYPPRTEQNVRDSDGTVVFGNPYSPGCSLTVKLCKRHKKPYLIMETVSYDPVGLLKFVLNNGIKTLNVAGNRERSTPGIYALTLDTIVRAFRSLRPD